MRFEPAIAPHIAAELAGVRIEIATIAESLRRLCRRAEIVVVEGVGGFLVPLNERDTAADLARRLACRSSWCRNAGLAAQPRAASRAQIASLRLALAPVGWSNCIVPDMPDWERNMRALNSAPRLSPDRCSAFFIPIRVRQPLRRGSISIS